MRQLRFTPWSGSPGVIATVNLDPQPVNAALAAVASAATFAGAATIASTAGEVNAVLAAVAGAATFAGAAAVASGGGDVTAPTLSSAVIGTSGATLTLTYNEALDTGSTPLAGAFALGSTVRTVSSVSVVGSTVVLTLSATIGDGATVTVSYAPGGAPIQDAAGNDAAALSSQAVTNNSTQVWTPDEIFTGGSAGALRPWYRSDDSATSGGTVTQRNDRSGNGLHEVPIGTSPNPARQPVYTASDARVNNQPIITYQGEAEASANRDATGVAMVRQAPGTIHRYQFRVFAQEGPNLGLDRALFADDVTNAFNIRRPSGTGSSDATIRMRNTADANPVVPVDTTFRRHVAAFTNSTLTDYQQWGNTVNNGGNAGNTAGTGRRTGTNAAGNAWSFISVAEDFEVEFPAGGGPTLLQYARVDAYISARYGASMLGAP